MMEEAPIPEKLFETGDAFNFPEKLESDAANPDVKKDELPPIAEEEVSTDIKPHIVLRKFEQIIGDVMVKLPEGKVITDFNLIKHLLIARAPIVEVGKESDVSVCPKCSHAFIATGNNGSVAA